MAEQVRIDVVAEDKASKKLDQVADKVDDLEAAKPTIPVAADTADADRDIAAVLDKADKLAKAPAELLLKSNAAAITADIKVLTAEIDRLDANDPQVDIKAGQVNALAGDLDQLQGKLKDIAGTDVAIDTGPARHNVDELGKSADSSKSVLANMVGNATQDVGALGGVAGSAGVAIGQMGEYMADALADGDRLGNVIGNFAKIAGPVAGIALFTEVLGKMIAAGKEVEKLNADRADDFFEAIRNGSDAFKVMREEVEKTGELNFGQAGKSLFGIAPGIESVLPLLDKAKIHLQDWQQLIADMPTKGAGMLEHLKSLGLSAGEAEEVLNALMQATSAKMDADTKAANTSRFLADSVTTQRDAVLAATIAQKGQVDALDEADAAQARAADAATATARENAKLEGATMRAEQAARDMAAAWDELTGKLDTEQSIANLASDFDDMRTKGKEAWDATAAGAEDAKAKQDAYAQSTRDAKDQVVTLGRQIGVSVPDVKNMLLQIDAGQIDDVERALNIMARNRTMQLSIVANQGAGFSSGKYGGVPVPIMVAPPAAPVEVVNVTQHLPRGWRGDALGEARKVARRSGGLYRRVS